MRIETYATRLVLPGDNLLSLIDDRLPELRERTVLVVTSKIVSLCEGSYVKPEEGFSKEDLVKREADSYWEGGEGCDIRLTIKNGRLLPSAGIDESNGGGLFVLHPEDAFRSARLVWEHIRRRGGLWEAGVLITDSNVVPMRRGVVGVGLGWCGFDPLRRYVGRPDCFGVPLRRTAGNNVDALAAAAVFCMGEGGEQTPLAVIDGIRDLPFRHLPPTPEEIRESAVSVREDLYAPLLMNPDVSP